MSQEFEILGHTADLRLKVRGKDLPELLANGLRGLMAVISGEERLEQAEKRSAIIELWASNPESLLVDFLNEALFFVQSEKQLIAGVNFYEFKQEAGNFSLRAEFLIARSGKIVKEVKAVTYHDLKISGRRRLSAVITLDL